MSKTFVPRNIYPYLVILCKLKRKRLLDSYFEVLVTPNDPAAARMSPIVVKPERRVPEVYGSPHDPQYLYQLFLSYRKARRIYKSVMKKAIEVRNNLIKLYEGKNCDVTLVQKRV